MEDFCLNHWKGHREETLLSPYAPADFGKPKLGVLLNERISFSA